MVRLGGERTGDALETLLRVHQTLQLASRVVTLRQHLMRLLITFRIGCGNFFIHFLLHHSKLCPGALDSVVIVL